MFLVAMAISPIFGQTQEDCLKKAMDSGKQDVKACDDKKGEERKVCRDAAREKLSAAKNVCFEEAKKSK